MRVDSLVSKLTSKLAHLQLIPHHIHVVNTENVVLFYCFLYSLNYFIIIIHIIVLVIYFCKALWAALYIQSICFPLRSSAWISSCSVPLPSFTLTSVFFFKHFLCHTFFSAKLEPYFLLTSDFHSASTCKQAFAAASFDSLSPLPVIQYFQFTLLSNLPLHSFHALLHYLPLSPSTFCPPLAVSLSDGWIQGSSFLIHSIATALHAPVVESACM